MRSGSARVSEWDAPLLSVSGATTQTSSVRSVAIFSSTLRPVASIPSSLVMRMRMAVSLSPKAKVQVPDLVPSLQGGINFAEVLTGDARWPVAGLGRNDHFTAPQL